MSKVKSQKYGFCVLAVVAAACAGEKWPDPPPIDPAQYQKEYAAWRTDRQQTIASSMPIVGIWPLAEGDTPFGADRTLPVALPAKVPARAGVFRRKGFDVSVIPAPDGNLRTVNGDAINRPTAVTFEEGLAVGPIKLELMGVEDGRLWVMASDTEHPAVTNPPAAEAYPLDPRWRIAARFEAFDAPRPINVPDVRGGTMDFMAVGQLVFRVNGEESRLTAIDGGDDSLAAMFKDPTNQSTTYAGYRIVRAKKVAAGEWTALDFNLAFNPPCAFSAYTVCPLPPPENRLQVAIEAGEKRLPSAQGYVPKS